VVTREGQADTESKPWEEDSTGPCQEKRPARDAAAGGRKLGREGGHTQRRSEPGKDMRFYEQRQGGE